MIGFPFDSIVTFDEQGNPTYDRGVSSKPLKELIHKLYTTGVMLKPDDNLQVYAGAEGMTVVVHPGFCVIEGGLKLEEHNRTLQLQAADTTYDRIDTVVMRWDGNDNVRVCDLYVIEGTPASSPVRPTLTREGSVYEIGLADVLVPHGSTSVTQARITDTRYDSDRCGVVSGPGSEEYLQDEIDDINDLLGNAPLQTVAQTITAAINEVKAKADQGSAVTITPALNTGTKVADYSINGTAGVLYAPVQSGETVIFEQTYITGVSIVTIGQAIANALATAPSLNNCRLIISKGSDINVFKEYYSLEDSKYTDTLFVFYKTNGIHHVGTIFFQCTAVVSEDYLNKWQESYISSASTFQSDTNYTMLGQGSDGKLTTDVTFKVVIYK